MRFGRRIKRLNKLVQTPCIALDFYNPLFNQGKGENRL